MSDIGQHNTALPATSKTVAARKPSRKRGRKKLDGRTWQAKLMKQTREALTAHVGKPSAVQLQLIDSAAQLTVSLAVMDAKREQAGALSLYDGRVYLAFANTLRRTLATLGLKAAPERQQTLAEKLGRQAAA